MLGRIRGQVVEMGAMVKGAVVLAHKGMVVIVIKVVMVGMVL
jgi:hypothetical protein